MNAPAAVLLDGRYLLGPVIARGGTSTVHRGTDTRLDRAVAIKVMDPRLADDPAFRTRFEREARSAARIDHPAVVDVHDQGTDPGAGGPVLFLVMELVEGGTLRDVLRARGALGVPAAVAVLVPVLDGLAQAHRLGLVHRDVKPENVLISRWGGVKVADFGLVTASAQAGASHVGVIMGTVAYLSPEQVTTGTADPRSDVYAAGVLLYELLTGTPPYTGDSALSVAYRHVHSDVPAPSATVGDVPPELDELVRRATRRDPALRPPDAAALLGELRRAARRLEVPRVPVPVPPGRAADRDTAPAAAPAPAGPAGPAGPHGPRRAGDGPRGTRALPRPIDGIGPVPAGRPTPTAGRRRRAGTAATAVLAVLVLLATALVGATAWWWGTGRWTTMPALVGLDEAGAHRLLGAADLVGAVQGAFDDTVAAGLVTATTPPTETRLLRGSTVTLVVSTGRPTVPPIAPGTSVAAAEAALRAAGLEPVRRTAGTESSSTVPAGAVVRTEPGAGAALVVGAPVTLVVSEGASPPPPARVRVPFVIGQEVDRAEQALRRLDLDAEERSALGFGAGRRDGRVVGQSPGAGALVDPGTVIVLETL